MSNSLTNSRGSKWLSYGPTLCIVLGIVFLVATPSLLSFTTSTDSPTNSYSKHLRSKDLDLPAIPNMMTIKMITDLDKNSKISDAKKPRFYAILKSAKLLYSSTKKEFNIEWIPADQGGEIRLESEYNEAGRGMELSELIYFKRFFIDITRFIRNFITFIFIEDYIQLMIVLGLSFKLMKMIQRSFQNMLLWKEMAILRKVMD